MQGYKRKTYRLKWPEGSDLHGLEINMRGMSIEGLGDVSNLRLEGAGNNLDNVLPLLEVFSAALISWNLVDDDDDPVTWNVLLPIFDEDGVDMRMETPAEAKLRVIRQQDARMLIAAVLAWVEVVSDIPVPLRKPSPDGEPFPEASIPMETLSPSLLNSNTPN